MVGKVIKPIPGTGYGIGEHARFDQTTFDQLLEDGYLERVKAGPETATTKPAESASIQPNNKAKSPR